MLRFAVSIVRFIFIAIGIALLLIGTGAIIAHVYFDADLLTLPERARDTADDLGDEAKELLDKASPLLDAARDKLAETDLPLMDAPSDTTDNANAQIQIYFAPYRQEAADDRFIDFLEQASERIDCALYDVELPEAGVVLARKHREGVVVRLVTDSRYKDRDALQTCIKAGIPVVFDEREPYMHHKFCVVDSYYVWTGSTNITTNGFFKNNNNVVVFGSLDLAENYKQEFHEMFVDHLFGGASRNDTPHPRVRIGDVVIENYFSPDDHVADEIVAEINEAEDTIDVMAFSFTAVPIAEAMSKRMRAGVRVRGLFEKRNAGSQYSRDDYLAQSGAAIHLDRNPNTMHHKVIIIDAQTIITGSYNFSNAAETKNDENVIIIHDNAIAALYTKEFERLY